MNDPLTIMQHWHQDTESYTYTVESWPRETMIEDVLLENLNDEIAAVNGDEVTIKVENGQATYRLARDEYSPYHLAVPMYLVSSRLSESNDE